MIFIAYLLSVHVVLLFLLAERFGPRYLALGKMPAAQVPEIVPSSEIPTPLPVPSVLSNPSEENLNAPVQPMEAPSPPVTASGLIVPVQGVRPDQLTDTFTAARSEGRSHNAIDIPAPAGTPVLAVADGVIVKFWDSERGGITIYELSADKKYFYYYAHLQRRADNIREGDIVRQGTVIGYVGDTGNAGPGNYHLHFGISIVSDPKHYWGGEDVNPYPLLHGRDAR